MKNTLFLMFFAIAWFSCAVTAEQLADEITLIGWLDNREVHVSEPGFFIATNLGIAPIKVLDYDEEGRRYLVECIKYGKS